MKLLHVFLYIFVFLCATEAQGKGLFHGKWEVYIPDAPVSMQRFTVNFKDSNQGLLVDVKCDLEDIDLKNLKVLEDNGKVHANILVDGSHTKLTLWTDKGTIKGTAETEFGIMDCYFAREGQTPVLPVATPDSTAGPSPPDDSLSQAPKI